MAYSHDKTMLAKLGFSDSDKKTPRHDPACRYCCEPDVSEKIIKTLTPSNRDQDDLGSGLYAESWAEKQELVQLAGEWSRCGITTWPSFEVPINKGDGQYQTTIGFLDAVLLVEVRYEFQGMRRTCDRRCQFNTQPVEQDWSPWTPFSKFNVDRFSVVLEIKTTKTSSAEILRQLGLYKSYSGNLGFYNEPIKNWVVVLDFDITDGEQRQLQNEGIATLRLSSEFEKYLQESKRNTRCETVTKI
jgi:hypothetical protein